MPCCVFSPLLTPTRTSLLAQEDGSGSSSNLAYLTNHSTSPSSATRSAT